MHTRNAHPLLLQLLELVDELAIDERVGRLEEVGRGAKQRNLLVLNIGSFQVLEPSPNELGHLFALLARLAPAMLDANRRRFLFIVSFF